MNTDFVENLLVTRWRDVSLSHRLWECLRIPSKYPLPNLANELTGSGWINGAKNLPISWQADRTPISVHLYTHEEEEALGPTRDIISISGECCKTPPPFYILTKPQRSPFVSDITIALCDDYNLALSRHNSHIWWGGIGEEFFDGLFSIDRNLIARSKNRSISNGDWLTVSIGDHPVATGAMQITKRIGNENLEARLYFVSETDCELTDNSIFSIEISRVSNMASAVFYSRLGWIAKVTSKTDLN